MTNLESINLKTFLKSWLVKRDERTNKVQQIHKQLQQHTNTSQQWGKYECSWTNGKGLTPMVIRKLQAKSTLVHLLLKFWPSWPHSDWARKQVNLPVGVIYTYYLYKNKFSIYWSLLTLLKNFISKYFPRDAVLCIKNNVSKYCV